ncbi:hypothetical protein [Pseudogracilibacillus sp. SO30301A]|uniref:hypothetical protein n=1 Tax=Pseudogracilibacillus sp. SO30301A TaxID=3098291 RepID=UPI00300DF2D9
MVSINPIGVIIFIVAIALIFYIIRELIAPKKEIIQENIRLKKEINDLKGK